MTPIDDLILLLFALFGFIGFLLLGLGVYGLFASWKHLPRR